MVPIIWQDDDLLVINKPAGLLSLPDGYDLAKPHIKSMLTQKYGSLWIVHRLDRQTSGVLVLARNADAHRLLNTQFQERLVKKIYHAVVLGAPSWEQEIVNLPLLLDGDRQHRTVINKAKGSQAVTRFRVLQRFESFSLVEASPETGRRHQIRAHLSAVGLPVAGDELYGRPKHFRSPQLDPSEAVSLEGTWLAGQRLALHALSIQLTNPASFQQQVFQAPYPADFADFLDRIRGSKE